MPSFGRYEGQQEISHTGLSCIWSAKLSGDGSSRAFAVKQLRPAIELLSADALKPVVDSFIERAQTQRKLTEAGAEHWAPVYDVGPGDQGAYYVTDQYPRSVQKLIRGHVKLSSAALHNIVSSVVKGLSEIQSLAGRSHGNLKSTNVLIGGEDPPERAKVVITDPAPLQEVLTRGGEGADLRGAGELIHELVLHKPVDSQAAMPVPSSAEWSRLGASGPAWLALCNRLLGQDLDTVNAGIAGLERELRGLAGKGRRRWSIAAAAAAVLIIAAGAWATVAYLGFNRDWKDLHRMSQGWLSELSAAMDSTAQRNLFASDPHLQQTILKEFEVSADTTPPLLPDRIAPGHDAAHPPLDLDAMQKTRAALATAGRLRDALTPEQWPALQQWSQRLKAAESQQLIAPRLYLSWVLSDLDLSRDGSDPVRGIGRLLYLESEGGAAFSKMEDDARRIQATQKVIESSADPVLGKFPQFVADSTARSLDSESAAARSGDGREQLKALAARTQTLAALGEELAAAVRSDWAPGKLETTRLIAEAPAPGASLREQSFRDRIAIARLYRAAPDQGQQVVQQLTGLVKPIGEKLKVLEGAFGANDRPSDIRELRQRLDALSGAVDALAQRRWVEKDLRDNIAEPIRADLQRLGGEIDSAIASTTSDAEQWLQQVPNIGARHELTNRAWQQRLDVLLAGRGLEQLRQDPLAFRELRKQAEAWQKAIIELDRRFPTAPNVPEPFTAIASERLGHAVESALPLLGPPDAALPSPAWDQIDAIVASLSQWQSDATKLAREYADLSAALDQGYGLDEPRGPDQATVGQAEAKLSQDSLLQGDEAMASAVQGIRQRIEALRGAPKWPRDRLLAAARDAAARPEIVVAALRQLLAGPPSTSLEQFKAEGELRGQLGQLLQRTVKSAERREAIEKQLAAGSQERWASFLESTTQPEQIAPAIESATQLAGAFGVTGETPLQPWVRYNLDLNHFRQTLAAQPPNRPKAELVALAREFRERIPPQTAEREAVKALSVALSYFESFSEPQGPGGKWKLTRADDAHRSYVGFILDNETPRNLDFVLVAPPEGQPFYICTTEMPLDLFRDLVSTNAAVAQAVSKPPHELLGPRVFERTQRGDIGKSIYWLADMNAPANVNLYTTELQDPLNHWAIRADRPDASPAAGHPVQQVSAIAAAALAEAVGCRLPTSAEWQAAYEKFEAHAPAASAGRNLRDRTWRQQAQHIQSLRVDNATRQRMHPSAGIFLPAGTQDSANIWDQDDRALSFRAVDADGDKPLHQLVGNVAEFTRERDGRYFVIGGSALSPPELGVDRPLPVPEASVNMCWSDVGVRVGFALPGNELARLRGLVNAQPFLAGPRD